MVSDFNSKPLKVDEDEEEDLEDEDEDEETRTWTNISAFTICLNYERLKTASSQ